MADATSYFTNNTGLHAGAPSGRLSWFSQLNSSADGTPVPATSFTYSIPNITSITQVINYTLNVHKGSYPTSAPTTYLRFSWNGTVGIGAFARYQLYNATAPVTAVNVTRASNFPLTFNNTLPCAGYSECLDITRFAGYRINLVFTFNSTATGRPLNVRIVNVETSSSADKPLLAATHSMTLNSSNQVLHNANMTETYNATVTYKNRFNVTRVHLWRQMATTYYLPASYNLTSVSLNGTTIVWSKSPPIGYPIAQGVCSVPFCTKSQFQFIALNATKNVVTGWTVVLKAASANAEASLQTTLGGVKMEVWVPGDTLQVKVNDQQGVNVTGSNIVSILSPSSGPAFNQTQTFSAPHQGLFLFNFSSALPQTPLGGNWNVTSLFANNFDYGVIFHIFRVERVQVNQGSFAYSGDNKHLVASGVLSYGSNSTIKPANIVGNIFAVDSGSGAAPLSTPTISSGTNKGVYISNVTLLNGVFTSGESLIMSFTLVNPPSNGPVDVNVTIDHEWVSGATHGANVTIPLTLGDQPFTFSQSNSYLYKLNATLTTGGIRLVVTSLARVNSVTVNIPAGTPSAPPVTSVRQHSGLFKVAVTSKSHCAPSPCGSPASTNSMESPTYAYVLVNPPVPGRLLGSAPIAMQSGGTFTSLITSGGELGAKKLVFFVLGQDPSGVTITTQDKSTPESTILQATIDNVPTATQGQSITMILHLQSNSTILNMDITVGLNVDGQLVQSKSNVSISHGSKMDVPFTFNAPSGLGVHTFTFFSPEYGAPLITGTLQVSVLQSSLQVIIPAIIGLAAAIVILLFFQFRKKPETAPESSAKEKATGGKPTKPNPGTSTSKSLT